MLSWDSKVLLEVNNLVLMSSHLDELVSDNLVVVDLNEGLGDLRVDESEHCESVCHFLCLFNGVERCE